MNHATEVMISYSVYDGKPSDLEEQNVNHKDLVIERAWVPQTIGDCVWVFYRFATELDKDDFLRALTPKAQGWVRHNFTGTWGMP